MILNAPVFRQWVEQSAWQEGSWGVEFLDGLRPEAGELVVTHIRNNPFHGSPLETLVAMRAPSRLICAGVSTAYAVEIDGPACERSGLRGGGRGGRLLDRDPRPPSERARDHGAARNRQRGRRDRRGASPGLRSEPAAEPEAAVVVHALSRPWRRRSLRYRLGFDEPVAAGLKRIAAEQLELAISRSTIRRWSGRRRSTRRARAASACAACSGWPAPGSAMPPAARTTRACATPRGLGAHRDADALLETYDKLDRHFAGRIDRRRIRRCAARSRPARAAGGGDAGLAAAVTAFREQLEAARRRVAAWPLRDPGFEVLAAGLARTYRRGRKAMRRAYEAPAAEHLHDWRKRVKDHRYHLELLQDLWPRPLGSWRKEVKALGGMLGDEHDLAMLQATLEAADASFGEDGARALLDLPRRRQAELRAGMRPLGARLFAERQKPLARRYRAYWRAWQSEAASGNGLAEVA